MAAETAALHDDPALLPPRATADGTHRRLQQAALVLFAERGYHGVSMRELAAAAGVRASTLYGHVASKEELLRELILLGHEEHHDVVRQAVLESGGDPADQLRAAVHAHVAVHARYPMLTTVANNELHALGEAGRREVLAVRSGAERLFADVMERGVRLGHFSCPDAWLATAAVGAMGIRVAVWFRPGGRYTVEEVAEQYGEFALRLVGWDGAVSRRR